MRRLIILAAALATAGLAIASVHSPRVVSPHNADAYSLTTFAQFHRSRDLHGDERAWEIYKYLADTRGGLFGMSQVTEGDDVLSDYRTVFDPVKIINVYGYSYCYVLGPVMIARVQPPRRRHSKSYARVARALQMRAHSSAINTARVAHSRRDYSRARYLARGHNCFVAVLCCSSAECDTSL